MRIVKQLFTTIGGALRRMSYLLRASFWATILGHIELLQSPRGRAVLALLVLGGTGAAIFLSRPFTTVAPGEVLIRTNRLTGATAELSQGLGARLPGLHDIRRYSLRDQIYHPARSARADAESPFQTVEGLSIGVDVSIRYALDPARLREVARRLPEDVGVELVEPVADGILHRAFAKHTVREIFSTQRADIQQSVAEELHAALAPDGVVIKSLTIGAVDLPQKYKEGMDSLLAEELAAEKMRYTLELKEKHVKQTELEAEADRLRREKAAEAAGEEEIIAAKAKAEAMKHVLPFKEKEIEQRRLEAEAAKVTRLKQAEAEADARRLESAGEADSRRKLADAEAYRLEVTGKATTEQLARESELIAKNPLLIQKTVADKLSDKIQVIVAPPQAGGFFAGGLLGAKSQEPARPNPQGEARAERDDDGERF